MPTAPDRCARREAQALVLRRLVVRLAASGYEVALLGDLNGALALPRRLGQPPSVPTCTRMRPATECRRSAAGAARRACLGVAVGRWTLPTAGPGPRTPADYDTLPDMAGSQPTSRVLEILKRGLPGGGGGGGAGAGGGGDGGVVLRSVAEKLPQARGDAARGTAPSMRGADWLHACAAAPARRWPQANGVHGGAPCERACRGAMHAMHPCLPCTLACHAPHPQGQRFTSWWDADNDKSVSGCGCQGGSGGSGGGGSDSTGGSPQSPVWATPGGHFLISAVPGRRGACRCELTMIDHVLVSPGLWDRIEGVGVDACHAPARVSDHWPVWVTVRL